MNPRESNSTINSLPTGSPLNIPSLSLARLSPSLCPPSPSRLSPSSTSPSRLSPSSHFISSYSPVRLSPCPTCDSSTSPTRVSPCPVPLSPSLVLKKPIHISSFSQNGQSLEKQNQFHSSPTSNISTADTCMDSAQLKSVKATSQLETINKPIQSADMCGKTWPRSSKISRFMPISSTERSIRSIPITNSTKPKSQCGQKQELFRPQQQEKLKINSTICCRGRSTFESLSPKNLRHVEKSTSRGQNVASYQQKRQSQDPTLVRIRLGLIKTGRIINSGAQFSNLEKIKGSSEENNLKNQSNGHPAGSDKPVHPKIMSGEAKQIIRPTMVYQKAQNHPQASTERAGQPFKQSTTSPPKAINKKDIYQEQYNPRSPKEYSELVSTSSSPKQNKACSANESNMVINTSQCSLIGNQQPELKISSQSATSETETSIITSDQFSRMSCFQFPLKSPGSSTECGQLSRICRPVIKRTSASRPAYFKTPQAWRRSSSNQTGSASKSSQNRCMLSDSDSSKSSSSEATLHEDYRIAKRYRGTRLCKKSAMSCPTKYVGGGNDLAVHPDSSEMLKFSMPGQNLQCLINLDQQHESKHTLHTTDCDRLGDINCPQLRAQEGPPPLQPSVVADMRSGADVESCPEECVSTGECKDKLQ